jgi:hypothetical protein
LMSLSIRVVVAEKRNANSAHVRAAIAPRGE